MICGTITLFAISVSIRAVELAGSDALAPAESSLEALELSLFDVELDPEPLDAELFAGCVTEPPQPPPPHPDITAIDIRNRVRRAFKII